MNEEPMEAGRDPEIECQLRILEREIETLEQVIAELPKRFSSVLRTEPEGEEGAGKERPIMVPLGERVCKLRRRIERSANAIADVVGRCEL